MIVNPDGTTFVRRRALSLFNTELPRLDSLTLCVRSLQNTAEFFNRSGVDFEQSGADEICVAPDDTCGVRLRFTESRPT